MLRFVLPILAVLPGSYACTTPANAARAEPAKVRIDVGEFTFDAVAAGPAEGALVVLLHGFPQTAHSFRHQVRALAAEGYRVLAPDQRGYSAGARPTEVEAYTLDEMVDDVVGLVDAQGADTFHVVGHDWGAAVAWFVAMAHPDRVLSVTALSIPHPFAYAEARANPRGDQAQRSAYMQAFRRSDAARELLEDDAAWLREILGSPGIEPEDRAVYLAALGNAEALDAALNWYRAMGEPPSWPRLDPVSMPALYVWSTEDPTVGREAAELTERFVRGPYRFEVLEGVSHWIPEEAPERVNELLLEHLAGATAGVDEAAPSSDPSPSPGSR